MLNIKIILGSTRVGRFGENAFEWVKAQLDHHKKDINIEFIDLKDWQLPYFNSPLSPSNPNFKQPDKIHQDFEKKIAEADGFLILTPEYNHGYPAVLKNSLDLTYKPWNNKPVGFISWGSIGGGRAVEQLRLIAVELQMAPIRESVNLINPWELKDENGMVTIPEKYVNKLNLMFTQLIWWSNALKIARLNQSILLDAGKGNVLSKSGDKPQVFSVK